MFYMLIKTIKWVSIPILLVASMLSRFTASYELLVDLLICLAATVIALWAVRSKTTAWRPDSSRLPQCSVHFCSYQRSFC